MNFGEITDAVMDNIERFASDSALDRSNAMRWVNEAIRFHFCTRHNWDAMERTHSINTIANQELYGFPSENTKDIQQVALRVDSGSPYCPLIEESEDQLDQNFPATELGAMPLGWARAGTAIRLRPVPSTSNFGLRVRSWQYPDLLSDDAETNYWTNQHWDLVIQLATALGWLWLGRNETYQLIWGVAVSTLEERIKEDMKRLRPHRRVVTPSGTAGRIGSSAGPRNSLGIYRQYP